MSRIIPLFDYILVEPIIKETTKTGLYIPESAQEDRRLGKVIEIGPGRISESNNLIPMVVKCGDLVYYSPHSGQDIEHLGKKLRLIRQVEIYAKVVEEIVN